MLDKQVCEKYMNRCFQLAELGLGEVAPNPMVGAVIVHGDRIIGEGYHHHFGGPHAEVNAIRSVKKADLGLLKESTLFVNLEPCSHFGKTPPCALAIIEEKIPRVVVANKDPNPEVSGKGLKELNLAGCHLTTDVLAKEGAELNKRFITFHEKRRPFVILKWAQSKDGFISKTGEKTQISNQLSRRLVHKWRSEEQAIMIGTNTAEIDNPKLDLRYWSGRNPIRIVLDRQLRLPASLQVMDSSQPTLVFTEQDSNMKKNIEFVKIKFGPTMLQNIMMELYQKQIQSVLVEGGAVLLQVFIDEKCWDEARIFSSNEFLSDGLRSPAISGKIVSSQQISDNDLTVLKPLR